MFIVCGKLNQHKCYANDFPGRNAIVDKFDVVRCWRFVYNRDKSRNSWIEQTKNYLWLFYWKFICKQYKIPLLLTVSSNMNIAWQTWLTSLVVMWTNKSEKKISGKQLANKSQKKTVSFLCSIRSLLLLFYCKQMWTSKIRTKQYRTHWIVKTKTWITIATIILYAKAFVNLEDGLNPNKNTNDSVQSEERITIRVVVFA